LAERLTKCDEVFSELKGKVSGIVGTGASIEMVIGKGKQTKFERKTLDKLNLKPDYTATQIVQKELFADMGHSLTTLMHVLGDFANDMRILYSSDI
jgi:adenylosuccinate lyase